MSRRGFARSCALLAALALLPSWLPPAPGLAKDADKEEEKAAARSLRVAVFPVVNRSGESLAQETIDQELKAKLKALPTSKGTFRLPDDVMRVLGQHGEADRALRFADRWAKDGKIDSTALAGLDSLLLADAVLCLKISEFEVKRITKIGQGESYTTIGLQFALFDIKGMKQLWSKEVREQRAAPPIESGTGSIGYDETGSIETRTANQPPRAKDVADDLIQGAFKNFPKK